MPNVPGKRGFAGSCPGECILETVYHIDQGSRINLSRSIALAVVILFSATICRIRVRVFSILGSLLSGHGSSGSLRAHIFEAARG